MELQGGEVTSRYPSTHARMRAHARAQEALAYTQGDWEYEDEEQGQAGISAMTSPQAPAIEREGALARRIVALEASFFEDYGRALNEDARAGFECFMRYNPYALPLLGADDSGAIVATWSRGAECVTLRFTGRYTLDFAVAFDSSEGLTRKWGRSSLVAIHGQCPHLRRLASSD